MLVRGDRVRLFVCRGVAQVVGRCSNRISLGGDEEVVRFSACRVEAGLGPQGPQAVERGRSARGQVLTGRRGEVWRECLSDPLANCSGLAVPNIGAGAKEQIDPPVELEKRFLQVGGQSFLSLDPGGLLFVPSALGGARLDNRLNDAGSGRLVDAADDADAPIREVEIEPSPEDDSVYPNLDDFFGR